MLEHKLQTILANTLPKMGHDRMIIGFTTTYAISAITTNVVNSNPAQARCTRCKIM